MDVANVVLPPDNVPVPSVVVPSLNVTVPAAVLDDTVAVKVTELPNVDGFSDDDLRRYVVAEASAREIQQDPKTSVPGLIFDTDILVWYLRKEPRAAALPGSN